MRTRTISIPIHPDDEKVPVSLVHIPLSGGQYATICGPLGGKTLTALLKTLKACKDILVSKPEDKNISTGVRKEVNATSQVRLPPSTIHSPDLDGGDGETGSLGCNPEPIAACEGASPAEVSQ